jgi:hypothetical protein
MYSGQHLRRSLLRDQIGLNGLWDDNQYVPQYEGITNIDQISYSRKVTVPQDWSGKIVKVEFDAVNFIADVYINNEHAVRHVGGWTPFSADVTKYAKPGDSFDLRVEVKGPKHEPIMDKESNVLWPVGGWYKDNGSSYSGIADDVWLRAYGVVHIEDAFIQTSFRNQMLTVDYTVANGSPSIRTVRIEADAVPAAADAGAPVASFQGATVTLNPGETRVVRMTGRWQSPELWWPDQPVLHMLESRLVEQDAVVDSESRRFGFREFWLEGNQFMLNGVRANLYGDYQCFGDKWYTSPDIHKPEAWAATVDNLFRQNIRVLRWHHNPVPQYLLDVADEKGLLICSEAANYARRFLNGTNTDLYLGNCSEWMEGWVKSHRNHPCIYMWNATNEMTHRGLGSFPPKDLRRLGDTIRLYDTTRPVGYDGDDQAAGDLIDYHYPEGYNKEPCGRIINSGPSGMWFGDEGTVNPQQHHGSIYSWGHLVHPRKPTGTGECLHTKSPLPEAQYAVNRNIWWLGIWLRGLRYTNWTNVKPACYWFALEDNFESARAVNMANAYAPVALFDKWYDDLGITPYVTGLEAGGTLPVWKGGAKPNRTLILYNDEFRGTSIDIEVVLRSDSVVYAQGTQTLEVPLGEHVDIPYSFQVPYLNGKEAELVLRTFKNGQLKFKEIRRFLIKVEVEPSQTETSDAVVFSEIW